MAGAARHDGADEAITGINVTPLVDITLVLLIIFMVTAKIMVSQSVPLDLPGATTGSEVAVVFTVTLDAQGATLVDGKPIADDKALVADARDAKTKNRELRAVIRADRAVPHGKVIHVLDLLKQSGVSKIAFAVTPEVKG